MRHNRIADAPEPDDDTIKVVFWDGKRGPITKRTRLFDLLREDDSS